MNRPWNRYIYSLLALTAILLSSAALPAYATTTALVPMRSVWKYLDNGTNQGTAWRAQGFDDSTWASGWSELGYGDGDEATIVGYGPDPLRRYITTYFRQTFNVTNPAAITGLTARLIRDDGAVVYVNGTEVARVNLPTGTISYTTSAVTTIGSADEITPVEITINPSLLVAGTNTIAVEMHQAGGSSSDLSFALELLATDGVIAPKITRGPYLQVGTPNSVIVRWRTDTASNSRVRVGTALGALNMVFDDATQTTEHIVQVSGLEPSTRYYYSVGTSTATIVGDASSYSFLTSPPRGTDVSTRIWVLGDSGSGSSGARAVRNAYYAYASPAATNLWLMLGDNAYDNGTDAEYQAAVFDMYPEMLRGSVLWPTIGNHETAAVEPNYSAMAYYSNFTLPTKGEAGGVPSGTKAYYSFDYGRVHFICLDSMTSDRSPNGPMLTWLRNDLAATSQPWIIAFWHHPPYSKGSHDSDIEGELIEMRENALPILEEAGVDLVLSGHSHAYERSYLLDGHYGYSNTFTSSMKVDGTDGNSRGGGAYQKPGLRSHEGAVYVVSGSGAMASGGALNHPAMYISLNNLGSLVLDVRGNTLTAKFLRETGVIADSFEIQKGNRAPAAATALTATATSETAINLAWTDGSNNEDGFRIERCTGTACTSFTQVGQVAANSTTYSDSALTAATVYRYRVQAYNKIGATPSTEAEATTLGTAAPAAPNPPTGLTASAASTTQINLTWTDNSSNEDGFRVERCSGASCTNFTQVAQTATNVTSYSDSGLTASTLYRYRVVAFNAGGVSATSSIAESTTQTAVTVPGAPAGVT
ncbi:MAG: metallophosphoesterase, partial [Acidobacteriota bacterium]|nr:metallophosphoesterase [Acidobacteriota bacterium]